MAQVPLDDIAGTHMDGAAPASRNWLHLPLPTVVRQLRAIEPDAMVLGDSGGGQLRLPWAEVVLLSAGAQRQTPEKIEDGRKIEASDGSDRTPVLQGSERAGVEGAGQAGPHGHEPWVLDVFIRDPSRRVRIFADGFNYGALPGGPAPRAADNFRGLARLLCERASCAHNRGLEDLLGGEPLRKYDSNRAFDRESSALLYRIHLGDLSRYPLPDQPVAVEAVDLVTMLGGHSPMPVRRPRKQFPWGKRKLLAALQLIVIAVLLGWFMRVASQLIRGEALRPDTQAQSHGVRAPLPIYVASCSVSQSSQAAMEWGLAVDGCSHQAVSHSGIAGRGLAATVLNTVKAFGCRTTA